MTQIAVSRTRRLVTPRRANWLERVISVARQRRDLGRLDDRALRDIGITRAQATAEAARPIWDVPNHWLKGSC